MLLQKRIGQNPVGILTERLLKVAPLVQEVLS